MKVWMGNIAPGTSDDELRGFIKIYAPNLECVNLRRIDGDGSRPAAMLEFAVAPHGSLGQISMRLNGMFWKGRELVVQTMMDH